jgi:hypothetical protein
VNEHTAITALWISIISLFVAICNVVWSIYNGVTLRKETLLIGHRDRAVIFNYVERINNAVTLFALDLIITNASKSHAITIASFRLDLPWQDQYLHALPDTENNGAYRLNSSEIEYAREEVLNHRVLQDGVIAPGAALAGTLLFQGFEAIPYDLYRGEPFPVTVVIRDAKGREHRSSNTYVVPRKNFPGVEEPRRPTIV